MVLLIGYFRNMDNKKVSKILYQTADILQIKDANLFRINAYRRVAQTIENLAEDINLIAEKGELEKIPGIGKGIAHYIQDLLETGTCHGFEELKKEVPLTVLDLLNIEGLGPKKVKFLFQKFNINSLYKLQKLLKSHKLLKLDGWGEKSEKNLLKSINFYKRYNQRFLLGETYPLAQEILEEIKQSGLVNRAEICGSIRRWKETVGDLDILATSKKPEKAIEFFTKLKQVKRILAKGKTKAQVILEQGIGADLRVVEPKSFGAAIHYFTGSKAHNIRVRRLGMQKNLRINEYGVFKKSGKKLIRIGGAFEKDVFKAVNLPLIAPELREDLGEIEAGLNKKLPHLISLKDIRGDCHIHTNWSDGYKSILKMAQASKERGYEYIAITDHGTPIKVAHGLSLKRMSWYIKAIKAADKKIKGIKILTGIEVDIKKDGTLFLPDEILKKLDVVVAANHSALHMPKKEMTQRIIKAMENPYVHIIAHPTNRLINKREPSQINFNQILKKAKETKTILEINSFYRRLDINSAQARLAKQNKVKMIISTDAHHNDYLEVMKFGVAQARRGWLEKKDVVNTLPLKNFLKSLKNNL